MILTDLDKTKEALNLTLMLLLFFISRYILELISSSFALLKVVPLSDLLLVLHLCPPVTAFPIYP